MVFLLGSKDPEMDIIQVILKELELYYEYALFNGERCQPYNVYKAENIISDHDIICVECMGDNLTGNIICIDHHNEEDYGYSLNFKEFLEASSIGQVLKYLFLNEKYSLKLKDVLETDLIVNEDNKPGSFFFQNDKWFIQGENNLALSIPKEISILAASDHCLKDAYLGLCLGFSKKELLDHRFRVLSKNTGYSYDDIKKIVKGFISAIKKHKEYIADLTYKNVEGNYSSKYLFIREASLIINKPIAIKVKESGFEKLMLLGLPEFYIKDFISNASFKDIKLKNVFGVPNRGYAGGHIK